MGRWCSGNTTVFGTVVGGSIPSRPAIKISKTANFFLLNKNKIYT